MANATEHPSVMFGTAGRAFRSLEEEGVDVLELLQRIIDNIEFREAVVKIASPINYFTVAETVNNANLLEFLDNLFKSRRYVDFSLPEVLHQYSKPGALRELFTVLSPREASVLVMLYGLDDSAEAPMDDVIAYHRLSGKKTTQLIRTALWKLFKQHELTVQRRTLVDPSTAQSTHIDALDLSNRVRHCLMQSNIRTVGALLELTEHDLLGLTNFGESALAELNAKLAIWNLKLKQS